MTGSGELKYYLLNGPFRNDLLGIRDGVVVWGDTPVTRRMVELRLSKGAAKRIARYRFNAVLVPIEIIHAGGWRRWRAIRNCSRL